MPSTLGIVASGEDVFSDAVLWLDTARSVAGETTMVNYGKGGSALNATYGSSAGADTNDPLLLMHSGTNYLYLPGISGNYASSPDSAALDITGDIEIVARVAMDDWTPAATSTILGKWVDAADHAYLLRVATSGVLQLNVSTTGANSIGVASTASTSFADRETGWVKVTRVASTGSVTFYTAADQATEPVSWTQLGTTVAGTAGSLFAGVAPIEVGAVGNGTISPGAGKFYRAIVRNGIGGTTVFDANFATIGQTTFTESSANAATVTINRATSGRKSVAVVRNVLLFGTDDRLEIADNNLLDITASDDVTVMVVRRAWGTPTSQAIVAKRSTVGGAGGTAGWDMRSGGSNGYILVNEYDNGSTLTSGNSGTGAAGTKYAFFAVYSGSSITGYLSNTVGTTGTRSGSATNSTVLTVGATSAGTAPADMEVDAVAIWRRALSTNEIATAVARYA